MLNSRIFVVWLSFGYAVWLLLFSQLNDFQFLLEHWYYPAIMVLGAFVAGLTPEGGGAVAFPVLSIFIGVERADARDFSLMIQSIGMTSASVFILTNKANSISAYRPLLWFIPVAFAGFVAGMLFIQQLPVFIIQSLFLSFITAFAIAYSAQKHRGDRMTLSVLGGRDLALFPIVLFAGGVSASLFGTGADIILYTLLVTRFRMNEKMATHMSVMLMAALSILGYAYRGFVDHDLTNYQIRTWLCAYPVVLLMAPLGAYALQKLNVEVMLRFVVALNIGQLAYFLWKNPSVEKIVSSAIFFVILMIAFWTLLARITKTRNVQAAAGIANIAEADPAPAVRTSPKSKHS